MRIEMGERKLGCQRLGKWWEVHDGTGCSRLGLDRRGVNLGSLSPYPLAEEGLLSGCWAGIVLAGELCYVIMGPP